MKKLFHISILFILIFSCKNLKNYQEALIKKDFDNRLLGTWIRNLNDETQGELISYHVLSFWENPEGNINYLENKFYSDKYLRTLNYKGNVVFYNQENNIIELYPTEKSKNINERKGALSPFKSTGNQEVPLNTSYKYTIEYKKNYINIENKNYYRYIDIFKDKHEKALNKNQEALYDMIRLYQFHILNQQSKVKNFAKLGMENGNDDYGYVSGKVSLKYEAAKLGLTSYFDKYQDYPAFYVNGGLSGLVSSMDLTNSLYYASNDKKVFDFNYSPVTIKNGVASGGYYILTLYNFDGKQAYIKNIPYDILPQ